MLDLIWEAYQTGKVQGAQADADRAGGLASRALGNTVGLQTQLDRLTLMTAAMWSLIRERQGITDQELVARMREIDLRDGLADGRAGPATAGCRSCGRTITEADEACLYCGATNRAHNALRLP